MFSKLAMMLLESHEYCNDSARVWQTKVATKNPNVEIEAKVAGMTDYVTKCASYNREYIDASAMGTELALNILYNMKESFKD